MQIGAVLGQAWDLYKRFLKEFFLTAFLVFLVLDLLSALAAQRVRGQHRRASASGRLIAFTVGIVGYFWVQAALVELVRDVRDGRADRSVMETYRAVQPHLVAVIIAGILAGIGIAIGLILLIVPGLFLLTIWSMLVPVIVIEGKSAGESFTPLARGRAWERLERLRPDPASRSCSSRSPRADPAPVLAAAGLPRRLARLTGRHSLTVPFAAATLTTAYFTLTAGRSVDRARQPATETPPSLRESPSDLTGERVFV